MSEFDIHPDMNELLAAKAAKPQGFNPTEQRLGHNVYGATLQRAYPLGMQVSDRQIACPGAGVAGLINVRVYRPADIGDNAPCVVYLHGGGFVLGSLDSGDGVAWGISDEVGAVVISVDYRLAPENPFPAAPEDCHGALSYISSHPREFGIDPSRIAIWGDSAGGNLAVATCMMARDRGGPNIVAHAAVYPVLTSPGALPSHAKYAHSPGLTASFMENAWDAYVGANNDGDQVYAAPLKSTDLSGMPPAHVHIAEIDPLADDGREYVRKLLASGVDAELHVARRMIHGFARARHSGPAAAAEFASICRSLRGHLRI